MAKEWILKRPASLPLRMTVQEKRWLTAKARATGLSMVEYARRKIFEIQTSPPPLTERRARPQQALSEATKSTP